MELLHGRRTNRSKEVLLKTKSSFFFKIENTLTLFLFYYKFTKEHFDFKNTYSIIL